MGEDLAGRLAVDYSARDTFIDYTSPNFQKGKTDQASGFYAQLNARAASSYYVDFANTLSAPSYVLWGAKIGYEAPSKKWEVFVDARNLTNQRYVTAANTTYDAKGQDSANFFPGDPFNVTTGVAYHF